MPQIKVLIVICYFTVFIILGAALFIVTARIPSESLSNYFLCESAGARSGTPGVITEKTTIAVLSTTFLVLLQLYIGVNLIYAAKFTAIRQMYVIYNIPAL